MLRTLPLLGIAFSLWAADPSYFRDVRPILQRQCQGCHQPNLKSSNLDLTTYQGLKEGGKRGTAFPLLVSFLTGEMKPQMPLGQPPLTPEQIEHWRQEASTRPLSQSSRVYVDIEAAEKQGDGIRAPRLSQRDAYAKYG